MEYDTKKNHCQNKLNNNIDDAFVDIESENEDSDKIFINNFNNETNSIDVLVIEKNKNLTADELLNSRQKETSFYKQDCHRIPKIKSMTASDLC